MSTDLLPDHNAGRWEKLDTILDQLETLRTPSGEKRDDGARAPDLPSRDVVAEIVKGLVAVLYPRHFGPSGLTARETDEFLAHTLTASLGLLEGQIRRELVISAADGEAGGNPVQQAGEITHALATSLPKIRALLDSDVRAAFDGDPAAKSVDEVVLCYPGVAAVIRHRLAHQLYLSGAPMLARIIAELSHSETTVDIHPGAEIGEGFFIDHGTGVVIGETAVIGRHVRLYQAVTLGAKRFEVTQAGDLVKGQPRHPVIEDDVVIYAGATILGRITIGQGSSIGGNVWLTHSVPPKSNITQAKVRTESFNEGDGI
ncbi:MAG TPA: serine O-acetyltransferase EpsC [Paraburkholderia sp.]|nr:serine O-acetyltransferase EpsC [Paraburkholderia sp.]